MVPIRAGGNLAATAHAVSIYRNRRFSDHAPLTVDYDFALHP